MESMGGDFLTITNDLGLHGDKTPCFGVLFLACGCDQRFATVRLRAKGEGREWPYLRKRSTKMRVAGNGGVGSMCPAGPSLFRCGETGLHHVVHPRQLDEGEKETE